MRRAILLILVLTLVPAARAMASPTDVILDCENNGRLDHAYTQKELRGALAHLPSDIDEYTNCRDIIRGAQLAAAGGGSGGSGGSSGSSGTTGGGSGSGGSGSGAGTTSAPGDFGGFSGVPANGEQGASAAERQALADARSAGGQAVPIGGAAIVPGAVDRRTTAVSGSVLPTPLWIVLAIGAAGLIALGALDLRRRVLAHRGH